MNYRLGEFQEFNRYQNNEESYFSDEWVNHFPRTNKKALSLLAEQEKKHFAVKSNTSSLSAKASPIQIFRTKFVQTIKGSVVASLVALFDRFA